MHANGQELEMQAEGNTRVLVRDVVARFGKSMQSFE